MLVLKNKIEAIFKELGMPENLTVTRDKHTRFVSISGQCGEPILTITEVEVSAKLTKAEREILINDYIVPTLTANKKAILDYIKLREDTSIDDKYNELNRKYKLDFRAKGWDGLTIGFLSISENDCEISYYIETDEYKVTIFDVAFDDAITNIKKLLKTAKKILPIYKKVLEAKEARKNKLSEVKSLLNKKCGF